MSATTIDRVRELNDSFRSSFVGGAVMLTDAVDALEPDAKRRLLEKVRDFDQFEDGNDPYREHDFGAITFEGEQYLFKLDYYDRACKFASPDPANPAVTTRVLTIMHALDY
ncbi:DUF3768 domain-containing protein [Brevundimonas sp.]|uniref:DUF3768 domain-containing protein n=1 Tax=Brevundimonas sp. TaxID=1871086 RepID=UPI0035165292